ncbi:MAG: hypothetical protein JNJ83_19900 [Verrucomicrobiaceae bacterium]|nr:hypothetical protein [Verrucomicrobiaceae bacterium]
MSTHVIDIDFEGFFLCRLATDPDPSLEERGISGFTYAVAGESLLNPAIFCQPEDVQKTYGLKPPEYRDRAADDLEQFDIVNIRQASPDYASYNTQGIGINVTGVKVNGSPDSKLTSVLANAKVRFCVDGVKGWNFPGPIFEGRNQIVSDGDPDRFSVNPFVFQIKDAADKTTFVQRFDPLDFDHPQNQMWQTPGDVVARRLPVQRFPQSQVLLNSLGIEDPIDHFTMRSDWLAAKVAEAEACGKTALAEAYKSRQFAVDFFTQATGPTVLSNRLASRIPLRQLYIHEIRGTPQMAPIVVNSGAFAGYTIRTNEPWPVQYYIGAFDGDLMTGYITGTLTLPADLPA